MIKAKFNLADIQELIQVKVQRANTAIINAYKYAGETFVREARLKTATEGGFNDITGNLRSSIGFIIVNDGKQIIEDFTESGNGSDRTTGVNRGLDFAMTIAADYPKGIALICVAGMEYAAAVESKGKDVITGSTLNLAQQLKELLNQI